MQPFEQCPVAHPHLNVVYSCSAEFSLPASNGYRITVSAELEGSADSVTLAAEGNGGEVQYTVPGTVSATGIKASFGHLGRVAVRFKPSGRVRQVRVPKKCIKERPPVVSSRLGSFLGTVAFRGEHGFTDLVAHRAQGGIGDPVANSAKKLVCSLRESAARRERELETVSLDGTPPAPAKASFGATLSGSGFPLPLPEPSPPDEGKYMFFAGAAKQSGRVSIISYAAVLGGPQDFLYDKALTTATVNPPAPFSGTGSFRRNADGTTSWTGDLAVAMPGLGTVPLTGGKAELATLATHEQQSEEDEKGR